jgi:hypothetical protein
MLAGALPAAAAPATDLGGELLDTAVNYSSVRSNRPSSIDGDSGDGYIDTAANYSASRSNRPSSIDGDSGDGYIDTAVNYSSVRSNRPSSIDGDSGGGHLDTAVSYSSSRSNRPSMNCNDGAIVACFEGREQVSCASEAGGLRSEIPGDAGPCATHGGVNTVSVQPYDFVCAMTDAEFTVDAARPIFLKPCEVRRVCLDGADTCEDAKALTLVGAFPDITVDQLTEGNVGLAVIAELDRVFHYLADVEARGTELHLNLTVKPIRMERTNGDAGATKLASMDTELSATSTSDLDTALTMVCSEDAQLVETAAPVNGGGEGGCTPTLADLVKDWPFATANGGTHEDQKLVVADFRDAATLELSDKDLSIAKISANVADASISYRGGGDGRDCWDLSSDRTATTKLPTFPEAEFKGAAVGAGQASTMGRTAMLLNAVRGAVQAGVAACIEGGVNAAIDDVEEAVNEAIDEAN